METEDTPPISRIYYADVSSLSDPAVFDGALSRVPESRKRKALAMHYEESQRQCLGVGLLLVLALEKKGIEGQKIRIEENQFGKPFFPEHPEIQFNLSHSGKWVLCGISDLPLGCDAEKIRRGSEKLSKRFFHPMEQKALAALVPEFSQAWQKEFARIWTRKESYIKAIGAGLSLPMRSFSVLADTPDTYFEDYCADPDYSFSCCLLGAKRQVCWERVSLNGS